MRVNLLARSLLGGDAPPKAMLLQRARIFEAAGRGTEASALRDQADSLVADSAFDRYLMAAEANQNHDYLTAVELMETRLRDKPQDYSSWFGLGSAHFGLGRFAKSEGCYTTCIALRPKLHLAYFMRGVSRLNQKSFEEAKHDFDVVLQLIPDYPAALVNRALARRGLGDNRSAIADLTAALDAGATQTRVYFIRAGLKRAIGDTAGADSDRLEGIRRAPRDELSWIARGVARLKDDPVGSLSDFRQALKLNPRSTVALQNIAHVLSERLDRNDEAVAAMNRLVEAAPTDAAARVNRGVLLARLGRRAEAVADARAAVKGVATAPVAYRAACIYALLVDNDNDNDNALQSLAVSWLGESLRARPALVATAIRDHDLISLRDDPTFRRLIAAAHALEHEASRRH